ncbi:MAG: wax ester/triacylglycerol synthase family O-acyltransferase [Chloroflexota bacterium]
MAESITPLSNVDAAWLKMEDPTNLMMVTGVLTFNEPLDMERFRALIETRLLTFDRFRQRVVIPSVPLAPPYWEPDPTFHVDAHLHHIALPHPRDKSALQYLVSDLMSTPLDFSKSPWQMHVVDGYYDGGALIVRLHHCMADGMALVGVLLALTELTPDAASPESLGLTYAPQPNGQQPSSLDALGRRFRNMTRAGVSAGRRAAIQSLETFLNPDNARRLAEQGSDYLHSASKLVLRSADPKTVLKGSLGVAKLAAWSRPLPLAEVKAMRKATEATINDLMTTIMTGGLRRYLEMRGDDPTDVTIRAAVPVNLRKPEEMGEMGNKFGLVFLDLPVGAPTLKERLRLVQRRMDALKDSPEAVVALDILGGIGFSPQVVEDIVVRIIGMKATTVLTNVPGPPIPLYMAGQKIEDLMFWVPQSGRLGMGLSIMSYAGNIYVGVATDAGLIPDPDNIVNCFYMEYDELLSMMK